MGPVGGLLYYFSIVSVAMSQEKEATISGASSSSANAGATVQTGDGPEVQTYTDDTRHDSPNKMAANVNGTNGNGADANINGDDYMYPRSQVSQPTQPTAIPLRKSSSAEYAINKLKPLSTPSASIHSADFNGQDPTTQLTFSPEEDYDEQVRMEYLPRWSRATSVISAHADVDVPKISGDVPLIQFECRQDPEFMKVVGALGQIINLTDKNSYKWMIDVKKFHEIISRETVPISHALLGVGGLPFSGKSELVRTILSAHILGVGERGEDIQLPSEVTRGLTIYEVNVLGSKIYNKLTWTLATPRSPQAFTAASAITHCSLLQSKIPIFTSLKPQTNEPFFNKPFFNKPLLDAHFYQTYSDVYHLVHAAKNNLELRTQLANGITLVKIWDVGANKGLYQFLAAIGIHTNKLLGCVFLDLERDASNLGEKPDMSSERYVERGDDVTMMNWGTRLEYLARCVLVCHPKSSVIMVATHRGKLPKEELEKAKMRLEEELIPSIEKYTGRKIHHDILCINSKDQEELLHLKETIENIFVQFNKESQNIPLTWIFLRTALYSSGHLTIKKSQLKEYAHAYDIRDWTFEKFLKTFTDLGSILYIPEIPALRSDVIIEPMDFINTLCQVFYPPSSEEDAFKYGLITEEAMQDMLGEYASLITDILMAISLLVKVGKDRIYKAPSPPAVKPASSHRKVPPPASLGDFIKPKDKRQSPLRAASQMLYYVPDARVHSMMPLEKKPNSLYIEFTLLYTPPDLQCLFVGSAFEMFDNCKLQQVTECNVTKLIILSQGHTTNIIYTNHGRIAELSINTPSRYFKSHCKKVVQVFVSSLQNYRRFRHSIECAYYLCCLKDIKDPHSSTKETIDITSTPTSSLCTACQAQSKTYPYRDEWIGAVKAHYQRPHAQSASHSGENLSSTDVQNVSMTLADMDIEQTYDFAEKLGFPKEEASSIMFDYQGWRRIQMFLLKWGNTYKNTRANLSKVLTDLGYANVLN